MATESIILTIFILIVFVILGTFALGGVLAAPWVPLWKKDIRRMLAIAGVKKGELVVDLGAGDGRIIKIAANEFGAYSVGYEMAVLPYFLGYITIIVLGLRKKASLRFGNFYNHDLSQADVICAFLSPEAMKKLKTKFENEAKPGCRIVSFAFSIPGWEPTKIDKPNTKTTTVYLYQR